MTFVFTGSGNVSQGAQEIFQELPHEYVSPSMLSKVAKDGSIDKIYVCEVSRDVDGCTKLNLHAIPPAKHES